MAVAWGIFKWGEPSLGFGSMGVLCVQSESDFAMDCCRNGGENIRADYLATLAAEWTAVGCECGCKEVVICFAE